MSKLGDLLSNVDPAKADELVEYALLGLDTVDTLLGGSGPIKEAEGVLNGIRSVIDAVKAAFASGDITAATVDAERATLDNTDATKLAADDTKADQALADKFPKGE